MFFFLDIQLLDYNGMILADQIRKMGQYNFTPIVFITSMPTREIEAYRQIGWCYYLLKPFTDQELEAILEKVLVDYFDAQKKDMSQITLDYKGHTQKVYLEDIAYVEYKLRRILIKFINDEEPHRYKYMPLKQFAKDLSDDFIQIHQSLLVNKKHIKNIDRNRHTMVVHGADRALPIGSSFRTFEGMWSNDIH